MASAAVFPASATTRRNQVIKPVGPPVLSALPVPVPVPPRSASRQQHPESVPPPTLEQILQLKDSLLARKSAGSPVPLTPASASASASKGYPVAQATTATPSTTATTATTTTTTATTASKQSTASAPTQSQSATAPSTSSASTDDGLFDFLVDLPQTEAEQQTQQQQTDAILESLLNTTPFDASAVLDSLGFASPAVPSLPLDQNSHSVDQQSFAQLDFSLFDFYSQDPSFLDLFGDAQKANVLDHDLAQSATVRHVAPSDVFGVSDMDGVVYVNDQDDEDLEDVKEEVEEPVGDVEEAEMEDIQAQDTMSSPVKFEAFEQEPLLVPATSAAVSATGPVKTATRSSTKSSSKSATSTPTSTSTSASTTSDSTPVAPAVKRGRGRPRKAPPPPPEPVSDLTSPATKKRKASTSISPANASTSATSASAAASQPQQQASTSASKDDDEDDDINYYIKMAEDAVHSNSKPTKIFGEPAPLLQRPLRKGQAEGLSLHKFKPQRPMDPDLAREYLVLKDPSLTSKERRQLRNKLSARSFRERRKEYIDTLEAELRRVVNENVAIQEEFEKGEQERDELRRRVEELEALVAGVKISGEKESDCKSGVSSGSGSGRRNDLREVGVHTVCVPEVSVSAAAALLERDLRTEAVERWLSGVEEDEVEVLKRVGRRRSVFVEKVKDMADVSDALMQFAASVACTAVSVFYRPAPVTVVNEEDDVNDDVETLCGDEPEIVSLPPVAPTLNQESFDDDDDDASLHEEEVMDPLTRLLESLDVGSVGRNASEEEDIVLWRLLQRKQ